MTGFVLPDREAVADLATYVARARHLDEAGAIRLRGYGSVLAAYVCALPGSSLSGGAVLGLRTMALAQPSEADWAVPLAAIADRCARLLQESGAAVEQGETASAWELLEPPVRLNPAWMGVSPPRSGWEPLGTLTWEHLDEARQAGITEIAQGAGPGSGAAAVATLRSRVWARPLPTLDAPAGLAWAAYTLGVQSEGATGELTIHACGKWRRLSTAAGHVLAR